MKTLCFLLSFLVAIGAFAASKIPDTSVSVATNGMTRLTAVTNVHDALLILDTVTSLTNYPTLAVQATAISSASTNYYPLVLTTSTNTQKITPRHTGDIVIVVYGTTNQLYFSSGITTTSWYRVGSL